MAYSNDPQIDPGWPDPWQSAPLEDPMANYSPPTEAYYPPPQEPVYYPDPPSYQQPAYQQPTYQQPTYQQPAYQQPVYQDQPTYQQPAYQDPYQAPAPAPYSPTPIDANAIYQMQLELQRINAEQAARLAASRAASAPAPAPYQAPAPTQQAPAPTYAAPQPSTAMETFTRAPSQSTGAYAQQPTSAAPAQSDAAATAAAGVKTGATGPAAPGYSTDPPQNQYERPNSLTSPFRQPTAGTQRPGGPHFLPGEDTPFGALSAKGMVPPFLSRLFAQARGDQSQGTDRPQFTNIPSEVPLVSKLAWTQMQPTEQQAFLSYISAYGIAPEDYFAMVESSSPQGGRTPGAGFGNSFGRYTQ